MNRWFYRSSRRTGFFSLLVLLSILLIGLFTAPPSQAHWADLAAAEVRINATDAQMTLTFPTGLVAFADSDRNGQLSPAEVQTHAAKLQAFLGEKIRFTNGAEAATLKVQSVEQVNIPLSSKIAPDTHSTVLLDYSWQQPIQTLQIHYNLFLPGISTSSCLATILQGKQLKSFIFTPTQQTYATASGLPDFAQRGLWIAIAGALVWGAMHSLTPGHGKTMVGAYLVGTRATPRHAIFLALTTTITHTIGVFVLGLITLFAAQYILPEQIYPWLSLISGLMVVAIGINLLRDRMKKKGDRIRINQSHPASALPVLAHAHAAHIHPHPESHHSLGTHHHHEPDHNHPPHTHTHNHPPTHPPIHTRPPTHPPTHTHHGHHHTHLPETDGSPMTWRSLLALGISGGLVPCPAALVLLLSSIALGNVTLGLLMVLTFSLGLAGVLTGLGLALVYAKQLFQKLPTFSRSTSRSIRALPILSAVGITLIGCGISAKALMQVIG
ncbi:MAG: sulfite exporter TauE/SafE family protein [Oscillatoriophycideae cyanobacterium NC_groundwater_1537_Pr4_S-0.65um_50_18]|nr:sulfite exporter TauE/SafE family protein [Oscillatoriophycideae cyanobacterium NC_groundwater_1537_Pr4_S-0.65um_50_18]